MRVVRQRFGTVLVLGGLFVAAVGLGVGPAQAIVPNTDDCAAHLSGLKDGNLTITTSSPAPGSDVPAGTGVTITATWESRDWFELNKILVCTTTNGDWNPVLAGGQKPLENTGTFAWDLFVPSDMAAGTEICVRQVLFGMRPGDRSSSTQNSGPMCFFSAALPPTVTTVTTTPAVTTAVPVTTPTTTPPVTPASQPVTPASPAPEPPAESVQGGVASAPVPLAELPRTGAGPGVVALVAVIVAGLGGLSLALARRLARA